MIEVSASSVGCLNGLIDRLPVDAPLLQETPIGRRSPYDINYVVFDNTIHIQTSLNKLGTDCAIFFEFKHWKPDKKKVSAGWALCVSMSMLRSLAFGTRLVS